MITFFTHVRPYVGEFAIIQRNATASWCDAVPDAEVISYGPAGGTNVAQLFEYGEKDARHDWLMEISSDILIKTPLTPILAAIADIPRPFVIGQRHDLDAAGKATLHAPAAVDYFLYRKHTIGEIPPFHIGMTVYDQWLVWAALERWDMTVIDATDAITAHHQNHGYPEYGSKEKMRRSDKRGENIQLARESGCGYYGEVTDAPYVLRNGKVELR